MGGAVRHQQSGGDPKLRYCGNLGHKADDESGLTYMRARYYDPAAGRFVSQDPARNGHNWLVYCSNDPVNRVDRSGQEDEMDWSALAAQLDSVGRILMSTGVLSLGGAVLALSQASLKYYLSSMDDMILLGISTVLKVQAITSSLMAGTLAVGAAKRVVAGTYLTMAGKYLDALGEDGLEFAALYVQSAQDTLGVQNLVFGL